MHSFFDRLEKIAKLLYNRFFTKKLLVFVISTIMLWYAKIGEDVWQFIAIVYIGTQGLIDAATSWKHGHNSNDNAYNYRTQQGYISYPPDPYYRPPQHLDIHVQHERFWSDDTDERGD